MSPIEKVKKNKKKLVSLTVFLMLIIASLIGLFVVPIVSADEGGTEEYVGHIDAGEWATIPGLSQTSAFFYYNSSGAYIFTLGGYGYNGVDEVLTDDITRTTIDNTGGAVANTSVVIGNLDETVYGHGVVFDWGNRTFYIMGGSGVAFKDRISGFSLDNNTCWDTGANVPTASRSWSPQGVWYKGLAYIFGGRTDADEYWGKVVCYCPANNTAWIRGTLDSVYGSGVSNVEAVYDGTSNYCMLISGNTGTTSNKIVQYNFSDGSLWDRATIVNGADELVGCTYNDINNTYIIGPTIADNNISWWNATLGSTSIVINNHSHAYKAKVVWDNRTNNKTAYFFAGGTYSGEIFNDIYMLDNFLATSIPSTSVSLVLDNSEFTISAEQGNVTWANESSSIYETGEFNISYNGTTEIDYIRINLTADLHTNITNDYLDMQWNIQNSSWNSNLLALSSGANTIWLNSSEWTAHAYMIGADPFPIQSNTSLWWRVRITIPTGIGNETYSTASWTWDAGKYV